MSENNELKEIFDQAMSSFNKQEYSKAAQLFEDAAQQGYAAAQFYRGIMYCYGLAGKDDKKAAEWLKKAFDQLLPQAESGDADAQNYIARIYESKQFENYDPGKAHDWFEKAAEQNQPEALYNLGYMSEISMNIADKVKCLPYYEKAAKLGNVSAMIALAEIYSAGEIAEKDDRKAFELFEKAAQAGSATALLRLGEAYENGISVEADSAKAREYYEKSAAGGNTSASMKLAELYYKEKNMEKAFSLYKAAVSQGSDEAKLRVAVMSLKGEGTAKDAAAAYHILNGLKYKNAEACYYLGIMYRDGVGADRDINKAVEFFAKGATFMKSPFAAKCRSAASQAME